LLVPAYKESTRPKLEFPVTDSLILGIDGGGTKTTVWLTRTESPDDILGRGYAGPSNQRAVGPFIAMNNLDDAVQEAFDNAGIERQTVEAACLGLAGADRDSDRSVVETWARETRLAHNVSVVNDAMPLLHAGGADGCGVALIAGTGSLAWGRNAQDQTARSGGWGYLLGDEGSAFAIGRAVLQAATQFADGRGPATCLLEDVCRTLEISSAAEIVTAVYSHEIPRSVMARLAPLAFDAAERLDTVACDLVTDAARDLSAMVLAVAKRLSLQEQLSLSMTGAVLLQQVKFRNMVVDAIAAKGIRVANTTVVADAVEGAVRMAQTLAHHGQSNPRSSAGDE
jgi:N-acetylglucosamine kinase-like BadF-type ATPase